MRVDCFKSTNFTSFQDTVYILKLCMYVEDSMGQIAVVIYFKCLPPNMDQNEWFRVRFFKKTLGRGSPSPLLPFFLGSRARLVLLPQFSGASRL